MCCIAFSGSSRSTLHHSIHPQAKQKGLQLLEEGEISQA